MEFKKFNICKNGLTGSRVGITPKLPSFIHFVCFIYWSYNTTLSGHEVQMELPFGFSPKAQIFEEPLRAKYNTKY